MTAKQDALYWREWGALARHCKRERMALPDRHELHARALGADKGHKEFTNAEFDKVLAEFRAWSQPGDLRAQMRQEQQPLIRLRWRVNKLAAGKEALLAKLLQERFKWPVWLRKHYPEQAGLRLEQCPAIIVAEYRESGLRVAVDELNEQELTQLRDTLCRLATRRPGRRRAQPAAPDRLAEHALAENPY